MNDKPALRRLDFQPVSYQGQQMWLLRDPYQLSERQLIFPAPLAQMLVYCDGTRSEAEIHAAWCDSLGGFAPLQVVRDTLAELDSAFLLRNERSAAAERGLLEQYRAAPHRPPALAGLSYPAEPLQLDATLRGYENGHAPASRAPFQGRAIVSPHIDYDRGGPVYARVWREAAPAVLEADLVVILGTDHNGGYGSITLTRQTYATPYGVLPADLDLVDRLAEAIGPDAAYAEELNHRGEHSVELSAVWLHHVFREAGREPCPMVPVLVGSFHHFVTNGSHPAADERLSRFLDALARETAGRRVPVVASVDLAHVGPNFGDTFGMDEARRAALRRSDAQIIDRVLSGDADGFYSDIAAVGDRNRICGFSPIYLMLRHLGQTTGTQVDYRHCPADPQDLSLVSICGLLLD